MPGLDMSQLPLASVGAATLATGTTASASSSAMEVAASAGPGELAAYGSKAGPVPRLRKPASWRRSASPGHLAAGAAGAPKGGGARAPAEATPRGPPGGCPAGVEASRLRGWCGFRESDRRLAGGCDGAAQPPPLQPEAAGARPAPGVRSVLEPIAEDARRWCSRPRPADEPKPQGLTPARAALPREGRGNVGVLPFRGIPGVPHPSGTRAPGSPVAGRTACGGSGQRSLALMALRTGLVADSSLLDGSSFAVEDAEDTPAALVRVLASAGNAPLAPPARRRSITARAPSLGVGEAAARAALQQETAPKPQRT
mmetsp:Transcript_68119/g.211638  ORF Transcript_68119/g.211638 Transcript_68119/m.211638 type:complete len:313 (+) Transcript_68119:186-1124(+)